jgi:NADPH2:quinone reductase
MVDAVRALAPGGVDVVADFVGGGVAATTPQVGVAGVRLGSVADAEVAKLGGTNFWVRPDPADLAELGRMIDAGEVRVRVAETFPLERTAAAHQLSATGHVPGKVVIRVS